MARIGGKEIPNNKRIAIALTYIYGVGRSLASDILTKNKINPDLKVSQLNDQTISLLQNYIKKLPIEGEKRRNVGFDIKRLKEIGCYRGIRHRLGLPVRGQITQKNARTRKGPRKTVANKKKADNKT